MSMSMSSLKPNYPQINRAFAGVQLGFEKHGTEKCIHSMRLVREIHPDYDLACPDGINAFPNSSREAALSTAIQETPGMSSLLKLLYGDISKSWFAGCQDVITSIDCKEGSVQGCPIGPLLCALAFIVLFRLIARFSHLWFWNRFVLFRRWEHGHDFRQDARSSQDPHRPRSKMRLQDPFR